MNCVYPGPVPEMVQIAADHGAALVAPCRGAAEWSALRASLPGILGEEKAASFERKIVIDPEIGFGTTREEDIALLGGLRRLAECAPVCVGVSRKRLVKKITGEKRLGKNLGGCLGAAIWCAMNGASVVRVHDVEETVQALAVARAFASAELPPEEASA